MSSSSITTTNAIIKAWTTSLSTATHLLWMLAGFAVVNDSEACSTTITARRDGIASVGSAEFWDTTRTTASPLGCCRWRALKMSQRDDIGVDEPVRRDRGRGDKRVRQLWLLERFCAESLVLLDHQSPRSGRSRSR
jgi:hypothetical protein